MRRALIATAVLLVALVAAPGAAAHATLQQSTPGNNSIVRQSPPEVTLQFSEAVETAFGSIRVYDCGGSRVDSGKIIRPSESSVAVELGRRLAAGTYTVTFTLTGFNTVRRSQRNGEHVTGAQHVHLQITNRARSAHRLPSFELASIRVRQLAIMVAESR